MTTSDDGLPTDRELIHRLRAAAEPELEVPAESSPLHAWLAEEASELAADEDEAEVRP
jgi:hypothetical protein